MFMLLRYVSSSEAGSLVVVRSKNVERKNGHNFFDRTTTNEQGCQMVSFQTKNPNLGKFWRVLDWKMLIYFMAIWNVLQTFGMFYRHLECFTDIWNVLQTFGIFCVHLVHFFRFWYHVPR
jgi:hypothetical protein